MIGLTNKIKIALIFPDKSTAKSFVSEKAPGGVVKVDSRNQFVYETSFSIYSWIKPFTTFRGQRANFVFTTEDVRDTDWFDTVIRPMQIVGTGCIVEEE